jgi:hypothetical protein
MAFPVGTLRVDLAANTAQFAAGMEAARDKIAQFQRAAAPAAEGAQTLGRSISGMAATMGSSRTSIQNTAFQIQDFAVQVAAGTSASRAFAQQLPQLLGGFGAIGAVIGAAVAVLIPLAANLFTAGDASEEAAGKLDNLGGALGTMRSAVSELADLTDRYSAAVAATADATDAATSRNVANIGRELTARRALLNAQVTSLRLDIADTERALTNLEEQRRGALASRLNDIETFQNPTPQFTRDMQPPFAPPSLGLGTATEGTANDPRTILQINKVTAQLDLMRLAAEEGQAALDGVFTADGSETGGGGAGSGRGGGGGSGSSRAARAVREVGAAAEEATPKVNGLMQEFSSRAEDAFVSFVTGAQSAKQAIAGLLGDLGKLAAQMAFQSILAGLGGGAGGGFPIPGRAAGGPVSMRRPYLVGERGPELFVPNSAGRVMSNFDTRDLMGGGGAATGELIIRAAPGVTVEQVRGEALQIVQQYDRQVLPGRVQQVSRDPRRRG